jgi:single-strand DNA-binding protein
MAEGLNRVVVVGSLGADAELRFTQSNQPVLNFRMATTEGYFDEKSKERKEVTEWHSIVLWGARGKALEKILVKGKQVLVEGSLQTRSFEKDGQKHYRTEIKAKNVLLLGGGKRNDEGVGSGGGGGDDRQHDAGEGADYDDSSIPF